MSTNGHEFLSRMDSWRLVQIRGYKSLVAAEEVAGIDFCLDVVEDGVVAVGNDGLGLLFEFCQVIHDFTTKEGGAVLKGGFVDDDFCTLGLDALHDALNAALTEVVGVRLHGEAEDADGGWFVER